MDFILEAFKSAPYYEEKTKGQQIVKVVKKKSGNYGTSCFFIYREDGTSTDISFTKMFRKDPQKDDVIKALRQAIDPIISNFRKDFKSGVYEGEWLEDISQADVDHYNKTFNLRRAGYDVIEAETGEDALERLKENPDTKVALLDIMLPGIDGFEVCRRIRATNTKIGIIMLTARSQEMDKVTGLMTGADDYVTKPFSPAELTARVDALFRRAGGEEPVQTGEIRQDPFLLNTRNRTLEKNGQRIKLTQVEYSIMRVFMENPGKALSREEILDRVWGRDYFGELKIVDVNIRRLRLKIEDNVQNPVYITTVWGYGYKWGF